MTLSVNFNTVVTAIKALSISGVQIKDTSGIPDGSVMVLPILFPRPDNFITGFNVTIDTFGTDGTEWATATYTLNYRYLHCTPGGMANLNTAYSGMIDNLEKIVEAVMNDDTITGAANVRMGTIPAMGTVMDNAGNQFLGCDISILVEEYT